MIEIVPTDINLIISEYFIKFLNIYKDLNFLVFVKFKVQITRVRSQLID